MRRALVGPPPEVPCLGCAALKVVVPVFQVGPTLLPTADSPPPSTLRCHSYLYCASPSTSTPTQPATTAKCPYFRLSCSPFCLSVKSQPQGLDDGVHGSSKQRVRLMSGFREQARAPPAVRGSSGRVLAPGSVSQ
uniref:Uncharacterized protein n=1 Tax=Opuntia streptacantha TaxID=393608 RepID=A0A7C9D3J3_OPUST